MASVQEMPPFKYGKEANKRFLFNMWRKLLQTVLKDLSSPMFQQKLPDFSVGGRKYLFSALWAVESVSQLPSSTLVAQQPPETIGNNMPAVSSRILLTKQSNLVHGDSSSTPGPSKRKAWCREWHGRRIQFSSLLLKGKSLQRTMVEGLIRQRIPWRAGCPSPGELAVPCPGLKEDLSGKHPVDEEKKGRRPFQSSQPTGDPATRSLLKLRVASEHGESPLWGHAMGNCVGSGP